MFRKFGRVISSRNAKGRSLRFEPFEDRRMLANADILFLVDESGSNTNTRSQEWLSSMINDLDTHLRSTGVDIDPTYGLVGFGEQDRGADPVDTGDDEDRFAHTQLIDGNFFTSSPTSLINAIDNNLASYGATSTEDGWDALEHAIAEYEFREGAVPVIILVQGDEGRREQNTSFTRNSVLEALRSKNAIVNTIIAGELLADGVPFLNSITETDQLIFRSGANPDSAPLSPQPDPSWAPIST